MSDLALYRTYRPKKFSEVIGQDHVVSVLKGSIENDKIAHAYLFAGSRGIGKTSIARIFARELKVSDADLFEIDGASNRGIGEIRELREAVHTLPFESPYKVYLIDEVHMLTSAAFNALLKTLEEPPKHVIFMLATTEMHKLPDTIISRCQTFTLKKPTEAILAKALQRVAKGEGVAIDAASLELIALLGEGSFRDAIGNLQKVISISKDSKITIDEVEKITGAPTSDRVLTFLEAISQKNIDGALGLIQSLVRDAIDIEVFNRLALTRVRHIVFMAVSKEMLEDIKSKTSEGDMKRLGELAKGEVKFWLTLLRELLSAEESFSTASIRELPLELVVLKVLSSEPR